MISALRCVWLLLSIVVLPLSAHARAPVWEVTAGDNTLYVGGTIHMLAAKDYPLPIAFDTAYLQAEKLVLELDLTRTGSNMLLNLSKAGLLWPVGETLQQKVSADTWQAFEQHMQSRNLPAATFNLYKPGGLIMTLLPAELIRMGVGTAGVDRHYANRAQADNKDVVGLETLEQQLALISSLGVGNEDRFMRYFIRDLNNLQQQFDQMRAAWRSGNNEALIAASNLAEMEREFPAVYESMLVVRNNAWMPQLHALLQTDEIELVLVGALHLVGEHGVIKQLQDAGYQVRQLP